MIASWNIIYDSMSAAAACFFPCLSRSAFALPNGQLLTLAGLSAGNLLLLCPAATPIKYKPPEISRLVAPKWKLHIYGYGLEASLRPSPWFCVWRACTQDYGFQAAACLQIDCPVCNDTWRVLGSKHFSGNKLRIAFTPFCKSVL